MHAKKAVDVNKGTITVSEENLNFVFGLLLAVVIVIAVWWLFLHNQSERVTEQSVYKLYNTIDQVCNDSIKRDMLFYAPQEEGFQGWVAQNLKLPGGKTLLMPAGSMGTSPYFYIYFEDFPPEGTCTNPLSLGIVCYWKEDLPWSNNLILTGVVDAFFGLPIGNEFTEKIGTALREGTYEILSAADKAALKLGGGIYKAVKATLKDGIDSAINKIASSSARELRLAEIDRVFFESIDETEIRDNLLKEGIIEKVGDKYRLLPEYKNDFEQILKQYPSVKPEFFELEKTTTGEIKDVFYNFGGQIDSFKEKIKNFFSNLNKMGYEGSLTNSGSEELVGKLKALGPVRKAEIYDEFGFKPSIMEQLKMKLSSTELVNFKSGKMDAIIKGIEDDVNHGGLISIPSGSALTDYINKYGDAAFDRYLQDFPKIQGESKLLKGLFERKVLLVPEEYKPIKYEATYAILRVQDIFTPAGATYLDRSISNIAGATCEPGDLCLKMGTAYVRPYSLEESSCLAKGVTQIKLKRGSMVSSDPKFYLVSPCFAMLEISKEGNTIYIEPKICKNKPKGYENNPNYCFATAGMVNFYVSDEIASLAVGLVPGYGQISQFGLDMVRESTITYPYAYELGHVGTNLLGDSTWDGQC